jgi:hypothetical protein
MIPLAMCLDPLEP